MRSTKFAALGIIALSLCSTAVAQLDVIGLTNATPHLVQQRIDGGNCAIKACKPGHQTQVAALAGGSAWDGRVGAAWETNGTVLDCYFAPSNAAACKKRCGTSQKIPFPIATVKDWCTGLTCIEAGALTSTGGPSSMSRLYWLTNSRYIGYANLLKECTLGKPTFCNLAKVLGKGWVAAGLASDDINRRLFIASHNSLGAVIIHVMDADSPCKEICQFRVVMPSSTLCKGFSQLKMVRGLAYDACAKILIITDGYQTIYGMPSVSSTPIGYQCGFKHRACCRLKIASASGKLEYYTGIACVPRPNGSKGKPCTTKGCNSCSAVMRAGTKGDPIMGNTSFRLELNNAPNNTDKAILALNAGSCLSPGVNLGFCGNILVPLGPVPAMLFFFTPTPLAGSGCSRKLFLNAPIPVDPKFCGLTVSFQWLIKCNKATPVGHGVSNCVTFRVQGL